MFKKSNSWSRRKKNFLLHKLARINWYKKRRRQQVVQLKIIEGQIQYNSDPLQSDEMRDDEILYINIFHKENHQSLIWVKEREHKCEKRKILLTS